jgi:hypothetical protein
MDSSYYYKYLKYKQKYIKLINNLHNNLIGGKPGKDGKPDKAGKVDKSYKLGKSAEGAAAVPASKDTKLIEDINKVKDDKELSKLLRSNHEINKQLMQRNLENKLPLQIYLETGKSNRGIIDMLLPDPSDLEQFLTIPNNTGDPIMHWIKFKFNNEDIFNYLLEKFGDQIYEIRNKDGRTIPELEKVLETKQAKDSRKQVSTSSFSPEQQKHLDLTKKKMIKGDFTDEYSHIRESDEEMPYLIMGIDEIKRFVELGVIFSIIFINISLKDDDNYLLLIQNESVNNIKAARTIGSALDTPEGKNFSIQGLIHEDSRVYYDSLT